MTPTAKLALLTLTPLLAACFGALAAAWRAPAPKTSSVIQHFSGGIVFFLTEGCLYARSTCSRAI